LHAKSSGPYLSKLVIELMAFGSDVGAAVLGGLIVTPAPWAIVAVYHTWCNYQAQLRGYPDLHRRLAQTGVILEELKGIIENDVFHNKVFNTVAEEANRQEIQQLLRQFENDERKVGDAFVPFLQPTENSEGKLIVFESACWHEEPVCVGVEVPAQDPLQRKARQIYHSIKNHLAEFEELVDQCENTVSEIREKLSEMIIRNNLSLDQNFVTASLQKTNFQVTDTIYKTLMNSEKFEPSDLEPFNLFRRFTRFDCRSEILPSSTLSWYDFEDRDGSSGLLLAETKVGPFPASSGLIGVNDSEIRRSLGLLAKQFRIANGAPGGYNEKLCVLTCEGIYYSFDHQNDRPICIIWQPPIHATELVEHGNPIVESLHQTVSAIDDSVRRTIAKKLVQAVFELHLAYWYHRNLSLKNVIAFKSDWEHPYIVGFQTARLDDGHSEPKSRPHLGFKDRYMQHPDRYNGPKPTTCRFRMKHDIYQLGVLLLELQKGVHIGSSIRLMGIWGELSGKACRISS
jgi:hypothetical protein